MNPDSRTDVVKTPLSRRFRMWAPSVLPALFWFTSIVAVVLLLGRQQQRIGIVEGVVEVYEVGVAPLDDGILRGVAVDLFDRVERDQIVALMDDTLLRADLLAAEVSLQRLWGELESARSRELQAGEDRKADRRRFMVDMENARLSYLDRLVQQERDKVDLVRLEVREQKERELLAHGILDALTHEQTYLEMKALGTQIREHDRALAEAQSRITDVEKRLADFDSDIEDGEVTHAPLLETLAQGISAQEALMRQLSEKLNYLSLRSPIQGNISRIDARPGATVLAGTPVVHIADPQGTRVLAHLPEGIAVPFEEGTEVSVFCRYNAQESVLARVLSVSPRMEALPAPPGMRTIAPPVGRPILIGDLPSDRFTPGQTVLVRPH